MPTDYIRWWSSSSGRIELCIALPYAQSCAHTGSCDKDVLSLSKLPAIKAQTDRICSTLLTQELKEYGAWDKSELADHAQNIQRLLWIACGDITDREVTTL